MLLCVSCGNPVCLSLSLSRCLRHWLFSAWRQGAEIPATSLFIGLQLNLAALGLRHSHTAMMYVFICMEIVTFLAHVVYCHSLLHFYCLFLFLSSHPFCLCGSDPFYVLSLCCLLRDVSERMWTVNHPCLVSTYLQYKKSIDSQIILLHTGITILSLSASVCVLFFSALWDWRLKVCYPPLHSAFHPWLHPSIWCIPVSPVCQWAEGAGPLTLREPAADQPWEALALSSESDKATGLSCQTKPVKCKTNLPFEYL